MIISLVKRYLNFLQENVPTAKVEVKPELDSHGETSVPGIFVAGDLTGIPLLKLAAEGGSKVVHHIATSAHFQKERSRKNLDTKDIIIVGAGPAGIAAAMSCEELKLDYCLLEASSPFSTIKNFPVGKPILAKPDPWDSQSPLKITDGTKESILEELEQQTIACSLNLLAPVSVKHLKKKGDVIEVRTESEIFSCLRVVLAIGTSGNSRRLQVPGESKEKVSNRLIDPGTFKNKNILVVGGGDSALEAAIALAEGDNNVTISYRKPSFSRPKEESLLKLEVLQSKGSLTIAFQSTVNTIHSNEVELNTPNGQEIIENDFVFTLIGRELPFAFFKRSGIRLENERGPFWWAGLITMCSFFTMLYFGKSGAAVALLKDGHFLDFFWKPFIFLNNWQMTGAGWYPSLNFKIGWLGAMVFCISGLILLTMMFQRRVKYFGTPWNQIKYTYLVASTGFFLYIYITNSLGKNASWLEEPTYWYSFFYCSTMLLFGLRRMYVKRTMYVKRQTLTLIFIQIFFLFLLPFYLYDYLILPFENTALVQQLFPSGKWSSFGFILFWPLNMWDFGNSTFWTIFPFIQTFGFLFLIVRAYGKGAYCGWICSCGGMAETLGDEYRTMAPHGPSAKKWELVGQFILIWALLTTAIVFMGKHGLIPSITADTIKHIYKLAIDIIFAGVLGLGIYFFFSGRIWCRYGCPLAALMHLYTRFSKYRILSQKKNCISCGICTKVCHMGIDVMGFANRGNPMNDVECVRCSTCISSCPMDVLSFGQVKPSTANTENKPLHNRWESNWLSGK